MSVGLGGSCEEFSNFGSDARRYFCSGTELGSAMFARKSSLILRVWAVCDLRWVFIQCATVVMLFHLGTSGFLVVMISKIVHRDFN